MATLQQKSQAIDTSQDLDELNVPESSHQNPLWKIVKSTAKRAHASWETTLAEGMQKHQHAINEAVKGAQNFVTQSAQKATDTSDAVAKGMSSETSSGIKIFRQSLGLKAASDELERELKLSESALGSSPAITPKQRTTLNELARAEQKVIQANNAQRLDVTLSKNEHLSNDRQSIQTELQAIGEAGINALTKLRMDFRAARSQIEQLNRTGQPVDVAKVFEAVRKTESKPEGDRSKIVSLLVGQSPAEESVADPNRQTPAQPEGPSVAMAEPKPKLQVVEPKTAPQQETSEISDILQSLSKTRLRKIATAINAKVEEANKITKIRSRDREELLGILSSSERLSLLAQNRELIDDNLTATAALTLKGDRVTSSLTPNSDTKQ